MSIKNKDKKEDTIKSEKPDKKTAAGMGERLSIQNLHVCYGKQEVLHDVSLELHPGELISLFGPSGCGKSSILKSIAGLIPIEAGEIRIGETDVTSMAPEQRGTVIVFQDLRLFPHMTAAQNLAFPMQLRHVPRHVQKQLVRDLLEEVQLSGFENRKIGEMSGGQQQRIALARALAANPRVLLLDEPFSGLDETLRREMGQLVLRIHKERRLSTILVTHDRAEAMSLSDRIALLKEGHLLQYGTPDFLYRKPQNKDAALYLGDANWIKGCIKNGIFYSALFEYPIKHADGPCEAMVRPGAVAISKGLDDTVSGKKQEMPVCTVMDTVFLGDYMMLKLDTPAGMLHVRAAASFQKGEKVKVKVNEICCF